MEGCCIISADEGLEGIDQFSPKQIFFKDIQRIEFYEPEDIGGCHNSKKFNSVSIIMKKKGNEDRESFVIEGLKRGRELNRIIYLLQNNINHPYIESLDRGFYTSLPRSLDTYFKHDNYVSDDHIAIFDFDYDKMEEYYSRQECIRQNFELPLFTFLGFTLFYPCVWFIFGRENVRDYAHTQHIAVTAEYIHYLHERHKNYCRFDCCCFEAKRTKKIYFEDIWEARSQELPSYCWTCIDYCCTFIDICRAIDCCLPNSQSKYNLITINGGSKRGGEDSPPGLDLLELKHPIEFLVFVQKMREMDVNNRRALFLDVRTNLFI